MPIQHTKLNANDVRSILRKRGYAFQSGAGTDMWLTKPDMSKPAFKQTGRHRRMALIPISNKHLSEILVYARNASEAADQIENISLGIQNGPEWNHPGAPGPSADTGIDPEALQKLVQNRAESVIADQMKPLMQRLGEMQEKLEASEAKVKELSAKPKRGRPPGSKNKPKTGKKVAKKAAPKTAKRTDGSEMELNDDGEPVLTPEQEAQFAAAMGKAGRQAVGPGEED